MSFKPVSALRRGLGAIWRGIDATRRALFNLLFLVLLIAIVWSLVSGGAKPLKANTALVLDLQGNLVEQASARAIVTRDLVSERRHATLLRDVLSVLDAAAKDPNISSVVLLPEQLDGAGLAMLHEVAGAIDRVKAAGKPVVAWSGNYDQRQYLIASHASEVYLHPMGAVFLQGFGHYRNYYRDALDKLGVTVNLMKVGTYKSFAEPFISNGPSEAAQEADTFLYFGLWNGYTAEVEKQRKLPAGAIMKGIDQLPQLLEAAGGNAARLAVDAKLVDGLKTRDELRAYMIKRGTPDAEGKSFRQVSFDDYLARQHPKVFGDGIGVVMAVGDISDGMAGPGAIGGLSTANLIRHAREDEQIKAIVLRVDSPGGSAYGAELIRRELELTRAAGKPVIVSMGSVAASGGYWISMAADEVIADPGTVTGSIGVFALMPTLEKGIDKLGIHTGGVTTTWMADSYNPLRPMDPRFGQVVQGVVNHIYDEFTTRAAAARKTTREKIDAVGQGRVWTGDQARERGLVDRVGSFGDAIKAASQRAHLPADARISYIEREVPRLERLLEMLGFSSSHIFAMEVKLGLAPVALPPAATARVTEELSFLSDLTQAHSPFTAVTHCLCTSP